MSRSSAFGQFYTGLATQEVHVRAYVMLMMASRRPAQLTRSRRFEEVIARDAALPAGLSAVELSAVIAEESCCVLAQTASETNGAEAWTQDPSA